MSNSILVGAQWGDEGKGKVIDYLTDEADVVVRSQGGNNAGHTIILGQEKYVLHLIPSGILRRSKTCVIANGVVVDPIGLVEEIRGLRERGITVGRNFLLSDSAHLVLPYHRVMDRLREEAKGKRQIGTTQRGIGPAYGDKIARVGLRVGDLQKPEVFRAKLKARLLEANAVFRAAGLAPLQARKIAEEVLAAAEVLRPHITNTAVWLHQAMAKGKRLLFEGAQGTFLDIDHGTYPYVTSSNTTAGGASTGSGVPPHRMNEVIGVLKAYTTRVGGGALPTESPELSASLHGKGREFGSTTGRARRCGWLDLVTLRYAQLLNGFDQLAITNLDGLDDLAKIKVCTGYRLNGKTLRLPPSDVEDWASCRPVYTSMPGWRTSTEKATTWKQLPLEARRYLEAISEAMQSKISLVSVGPARNQTIRL
jgi:adenylosuccinate synthase